MAATAQDIMPFFKKSEQSRDLRDPFIGVLCIQPNNGDFCHGHFLLLVMWPTSPWHIAMPSGGGIHPIRSQVSVTLNNLPNLQGRVLYLDYDLGLVDAPAGQRTPPFITQCILPSRPRATATPSSFVRPSRMFFLCDDDCNQALSTCTWVEYPSATFSVTKRKS